MATTCLAAASFIATDSAVNTPWQTPRRTSTMSSRSRNGLFGSLKHTLSKRKSGSADMSIKQTDHPHSRNATPATRRPNPRPRPSSDPNSDDAPPAYTPAPNAAPMVQPASVIPPASPQADGADDAYAFLRSFDTIFLIDDSGSMAGSRWRETADALSTITPICTAHDSDGIDIFFLNHPESPFHRGVTSAGTVTEIFQTVRPGGGTPTGQRLDKLLKEYLRRYAATPESTKPINIICITDGEPSDDVESPLISAAKRLDKLDAPAWQIGVQFFQVGRDEQAKKHLKQLDDELAEIAGDDDLRDMVDTVPFTGADGAHLTGSGILKVVLGAVTRRLDRKSKELHR